MIYIVHSEIDNIEKWALVNNHNELVDIMNTIESNPKPKKVTLYKAEKVKYKFELKDEQEVVIKKKPSVEILK